MNATRVGSALGGKKKTKSRSKGKGKSGKRAVHKLHIRHSKNGGYIAEHEFNDGSPSEEHTIGDLDELKQHIDDHMAQGPEESQPPALPGAMPGAPGGGADQLRGGM